LIFIEMETVGACGGLRKWFIILEIRSFISGIVLGLSLKWSFSQIHARRQSSPTLGFNGRRGKTMQNQTTSSPLRCNPLLYGSLFSGIGGIDLGFDRAGLMCAWQVEINPFARKVLAKHWPGVPKHDDIRTFKPTPVDVVCGGFPCQDISNAGPKTGISGERSGLWSEYVRIIRTIRPRFVVVENVSALLVRGIDRVLGDLAASGYDAEWQSIPAAAFGAPHIRERVFILAYARARRRGEKLHEQVDCGSRSTADCNRQPEFETQRRGDVPRVFAGTGGSIGKRSNWTTEPDVGRVVDGVPARVDRLRGLGNAVVPAIAEWIGRRLIESAQRKRLDGGRVARP
jgi:DNA (cytosine-5)-methyltransferase 1